MTQKLEETIRYLRSLAGLPEKEQERLAVHVRKELDRHKPSEYEVYTDEAGNYHWRLRVKNGEILAEGELEQVENAGCYWLGGHKPTREEAAVAVEKIKEIQARNRLGDDVTIRGLIDEGRRY